jgi:chemotaxis regulatin CheY-phosphate phosphatase CheZ
MAGEPLEQTSDIFKGSDEACEFGRDSHARKIANGINTSTNKLKYNCEQTNEATASIIASIPSLSAILQYCEESRKWQRTAFEVLSSATQYAPYNVD